MLNNIKNLKVVNIKNETLNLWVYKEFNNKLLLMNNYESFLIL